ncbi:hypothetical protein [Cryobacterium sp. Y29]|uniref:hypothetical protein n=1 Tax=Cryobacterium sp. Y29 TaxID=2048285 RepID=UPI000CE343E9|nr:hypothetical protein [Cryobacterium sp. Y29]
MSELATRIQHLTEQLSRLETAMTRTVTACAPELRGRPGVGYDSAVAFELQYSSQTAEVQLAA